MGIGHSRPSIRHNTRSIQADAGTEDPVHAQLPVCGMPGTTRSEELVSRVVFSITQAWRTPTHALSTRYAEYLTGLLEVWGGLSRGYRAIDHYDRVFTPAMPPPAEYQGRGTPHCHTLEWLNYEVCSYPGLSRINLRYIGQGENISEDIQYLFNDELDRYPGSYQEHADDDDDQMAIEY